MVLFNSHYNYPHSVQLYLPTYIFTQTSFIKLFMSLSQTSSVYFIISSFSQDWFLLQNGYAKTYFYLFRSFVLAWTAPNYPDGLLMGYLLCHAY